MTSMRPLFMKLGLKSGCKADILDGPEELFDLLHDMPVDIDWDDEASGLDWIMTFHESRNSFEEAVSGVLPRLEETGSWWIACKKGLPKSNTRLGRDVMAAKLKPLGYVNMLVCSVNDVWSAYKFVKRKELRNQKK